MLRTTFASSVALTLLLTLCVGFAPSASAADLFGECDKIQFNNPHWSKGGGGVVAKARAVCPKKYTIHISLKLYRCKAQPKLKRAWLEENCLSRLPKWNNWCERPGSHAKHKAPCYVPELSIQPPTAQGFHWAANMVIGLERGGTVTSRSKIVRSNGKLYKKT